MHVVRKGSADFADLVLNFPVRIRLHAHSVPATPVSWRQHKAPQAVQTYFRKDTCHIRKYTDLVGMHILTLSSRTLQCHRKQHRLPIWRFRSRSISVTPLFSDDLISDVIRRYSFFDKRSESLQRRHTKEASVGCSI